MKILDVDRLWEDARAFLEKRRGEPEWWRFFHEVRGRGKIIGVGTFHPF